MLRHNFWSCQVFQEENINTKSEGHFAVLQRYANRESTD